MVEKKNPLGPIGENVRRRVKELRAGRTYKQLSDRLTELGRPIPPLGLSRLEDGQRRVDVDDLVALSLAVDANPMVLMLPFSGDPAMEVEITPTVRMSKLQAYRLLGGMIELPLDGKPLLRAETLSMADSVRLASVLAPVAEALKKAVADGATPGQVYAWCESVLLNEV